MHKKSLTLTTPPAFQCYDCSGCGECCRGRFAIIISQADRARLAAQGWSDEELGLQGQPLFTPSGTEFQLAHHADGRCVFLNDEGLCRIHARFGEPAKPVACRLYPFRFVPLGSQVRVDVRFDCPATAGNRGRAITNYRSALLGLLDKVIPAESATLAPPPLYGRVTATWAQYSRMTESVEGILLTNTLDLTQRVLACITFAALLASPRVAALEGRKLSEFLETVSAKVVDGIAAQPLPRVAPPGMVRMAFRQIAGVYGRLDRVGEKAHVGQRLKHAVAMVMGRGVTPPLRPGFPAVPFADIEQSMGPLAPEPAAVLERYLHLRLVSMAFFGRTFYRRSYLEGLNGLWLTFPLINWFARALAVGQGLAAPDSACMELAVQMVDHHYGMTPVLDLPSERARTRFLTERSNLRALAIWYGG